MKIKKTHLLLSLVSVWAIIVQFLPTSTSPTAINSNWIANYSRLGILFFVLFIIGTKRVSMRMAGLQLINILALFVFSILTIRIKGFSEAYYNFYYYFLIAAVLVMDLRSLRIGKYINLLFYIAVVGFSVLGLLVMLKEPTVCEFLSTYYTRHWELSTYYMTRAGKPVGTYAVHSISGFMYFQFILLLYYKNKNKPRWYNIALIVILAVMIAMLRSNTAVMLLGLGAIIVLFENKKKGGTKSFFFKKGGTKSFFFKAAFVIAVCVILVINMDTIQSITGSTENGLLGRFTGTSAFFSNIRFIASNLLPIGFTGSSSLWLSDNGYIIAFLRGGIINIIALYAGTYFFMKKNVSNKTARISVLISIAAFEMGYPVLLEIRFICFIPFLVLFLNTFADKAEEHTDGVKEYRHESISGNSPIQSGYRTSEAEY